MKIIKPLSLGLLQRTYTLAGSHRFVATVLGFFPLGEPVPARLLDEPAQWGRLAGALPPMQPLDEAMPKADAEVLVFGAAAPADAVEARLRVGSIDLRVAASRLAALEPLPLQSPQRQRHAGTYDERWLREDWPGLARDLDWRLYNRAPETLRLDGWFAGGEAYHLERMDPLRPCIEGRLPTQRVRLFALREALHEIPLVLDTVSFFPAVGLGACAWRGQLPVEDGDGLDVRTVLVAYEDGALSARPAAHYAEVLRLRSDPATAALHAFNESQFAPAQAATPGGPPQPALPAADAPRPAPVSGAQRIAVPALQPPSAAEIASGDLDLTGFMQQVEAVRASVQHVDTQRLAQDARDHQARQALLPVPSAQAVLERAATLPPPLAPLRRASPRPVSPAQSLPPALAQQLGRQVLAWLAQGVPLAGRDLAGADLRGAALAGADLSDCLLEWADLRGADLRGAKLRGAALTDADLSGADCSDADFTGANLCGSRAENASFARAVLREARASKACWRGARGAGADLSAALLDEADFALACFDGAVVDSTALNQTVLAGGSWRDAQFRRCVAWEVNASGTDFSGSNWLRCALASSDLRGSRWQQARLDQVSGASSQWDGADLRGLRAQRCTWAGAELRGADLRDAFAANCDFSRAGLDDAMLADGCFARSVFLQARCTGAQAAGADFFRALLRKSDFSGADLRAASLYQADLTGVTLPQGANGFTLHERGRLA